ncbi:uncharacterized protein LOC120343479 [Styela clava]
MSSASSSITYRTNDENHRTVPIRDFRKLSTRNGRHRQTNEEAYAAEIHTASSAKKTDDDYLLNSLLSRESRNIDAPGSDSAIKHRNKRYGHSEKEYFSANSESDKRPQRDTYESGFVSDEYKDTNESIERGLQNELLRVDVEDRFSLSSVSTVASRSNRSDRTSTYKNYNREVNRKKTAQDHDSESISEIRSESGLEEERFPTYLSANYNVAVDQSDTQSWYSEITSSSLPKSAKYHQVQNSNRNFGGKIPTFSAVSAPTLALGDLEGESSIHSEAENRPQIPHRHQEIDMRSVRRVSSRSRIKQAQSPLNVEESPIDNRVNNNYTKQRHSYEQDRRHAYHKSQNSQRRSLPESQQPRFHHTTSTRSSSLSEKAYYPNSHSSTRNTSESEDSFNQRKKSNHSDRSMQEDILRLGIVDENKPMTTPESLENAPITKSPRPSIHSRKSSGHGSQTSRAGSRLSIQKIDMGDTDSIGSATSVILRAESRGSKSSGTHSVNMVDPDEEILVGDEKDLHSAARRGDSETVDELLELGTDINCRNETDRTPIHWAAGNGHVSVLKILLERDANIEAADKFGMNALLWASWFGHKVCVEMLLRAGAKSTAKNKNGFSFLHCAAQNNHIMVEHILTEDLQEFDRNITDDAGRTCLHVLAKHGRKEMLETFIALQCDVNAKDKAENTPLHLAAKNGFPELLSILVNAGTNIEEKNADNKTSLHLAAEEGKTEAIEELIRLGADVNAETEDEVCPLHLAVSGRHEEATIALINGGADVDAGNKHNQTPFHYAVIANKTSIVQILAMHNADANVQDARRETPLHLATENGYYEITEILLHCNMNLSLTDQRGKTPLDVAARGSYITIVDMILKAERHHLYLKSPHNQLNNGHPLDNNDFMDDVLDGLPQDVSFKPDNSAETQHIRTILYKLATKYLKKDEWRKLAFQWGFTDSQVQAIEEQYTGERSYKEHGYRMLLIWLNGCILRQENPVRSLFEGLVAIQRRDVAETIRSKANSLPPEKACVIS